MCTTTAPTWPGSHHQTSSRQEVPESIVSTLRNLHLRDCHLERILSGMCPLFFSQTCRTVNGPAETPRQTFQNNSCDELLLRLSPVSRSMVQATAEATTFDSKMMATGCVTMVNDATCGRCQKSTVQTVSTETWRTDTENHARNNVPEDKAHVWTSEGRATPTDTRNGDRVPTNQGTQKTRVPQRCGTYCHSSSYSRILRKSFQEIDWRSCTSMLICQCLADSCFFSLPPY